MDDQVHSSRQRGRVRQATIQLDYPRSLWRATAAPPSIDCAYDDLNQRSHDPISTRQSALIRVHIGVFEAGAVAERRRCHQRARDEAELLEAEFRRLQLEIEIERACTHQKCSMGIQGNQWPSAVLTCSSRPSRRSI